MEGKQREQGNKGHIKMERLYYYKQKKKWNKYTIINKKYKNIKKV